MTPIISMRVCGAPRGREHKLQIIGTDDPNHIHEGIWCSLRQGAQTARQPAWPPIPRRPTELACGRLRCCGSRHGNGHIVVSPALRYCGWPNISQCLKTTAKSFPFGFASGVRIPSATGRMSALRCCWEENTQKGRTSASNATIEYSRQPGTVKRSQHGSRLMSMALVTRLVAGIRKTASSAALMPLHQVCSSPCTASRGLKSFAPTLQQPRLRTNRAGMQSLGLGANVAFKSITEVPPHLNRLRNCGPKTRFHTLSNLRVLGLTRAVLPDGGDGDPWQEIDNLHKRGMASSKKKEQPRGSLWRTRSVISRETVQAVHDLKRNKDDPVELAKVFQTRIPRLLKMDLLATLSELQRQSEIDLALRIFDIVRKEIWYKPDQFLYREMLDALGRNRRISEIEKKFQELQDEGIKPEVAIYRELVGAYVRAHMLPEALEVHAKMVTCGCGDDGLSLKFIAIGKEKEAVRIKQRKKAAEKLNAEKREEESSLSELQS